jgi:predicted Fe-S protein YdhL (DUF1289 family)
MTTTNYSDASPAERLSIWRSYLARYMTTDQYREFLESEEYLNEKLGLVSWLGLTDRERKMLIRLSEQRRQNAWDNAWQIASHQCARDEGETDEQHHSALVAFAEQVLLDQAIIPPHFRQLVECFHCGSVYMPKGTASSVRTCRWCSTPYAEYLAMRKRNEI